MRCVACTGSVPDDARFCPRCGAPLGSGGLPTRRGLMIASGQFAPYAGFARRAVARELDNLVVVFGGGMVTASTAITVMNQMEPDQPVETRRLIEFAIFGLTWLLYRWSGHDVRPVAG